MTAEPVRLGEEILQENAAMSENHPLLCITPEVVAAETFSTVSTSLILMTKLDGLINELGGEELWNVLWNAFHVHRHLWSLWIKHRDIGGGGNITFWKGPVTHDNTVHTGTSIFQAVAIHRMNAITRMYEHDIESFFWVAMWVMFYCGDEPSVSEGSFLEWRMGGRESFVCNKRFFREWVPELERSDDAKLRAWWNRWEPLFSITDVFTRRGFSPTGDAVNLYTKLLTAKLKGERHDVQSTA